jgi:hypothetical protein
MPDMATVRRMGGCCVPIFPKIPCKPPPHPTPPGSLTTWVLPVGVGAFYAPVPRQGRRHTTPTHPPSGGRWPPPLPCEPFGFLFGASSGYPSLGCRTPVRPRTQQFKDIPRRFNSAPGRRRTRGDQSRVPSWYFSQNHQKVTQVSARLNWQNQSKNVILENGSRGREAVILYLHRCS